MTVARERAESMLVYYLSTVWQAAGLEWNEDNANEVCDIVNNLCEMIVSEVQEHVETEGHARLFWMEKL